MEGDPFIYPLQLEIDASIGLLRKARGYCAATPSRTCMRSRKCRRSGFDDTGNGEICLEKYSLTKRLGDGEVE